MNDIEASITEVIGGILTVAIIAVIVGTNSKTSAVIQSAGSAFANILKVAISPVSSK